MDALMKMWLSLGGIGLMFLSVSVLLLVRTYVKNKVVNGLVNILAFFCILICGFIMVVVVFSGPSGG
ncbi:MAG: DUF2768 domain-containing protein [Bacilli bacterium]